MVPPVVIPAPPGARCRRGPIVDPCGRRAWTASCRRDSDGSRPQRSSTFLARAAVVGEVAHPRWGVVPRPGRIRPSSSWPRAILRFGHQSVAPPAWSATADPADVKSHAARPQNLRQLHLFQWVLIPPAGLVGGVVVGAPSRAAPPIAEGSALPRAAADPAPPRRPSCYHHLSRRCGSAELCR